MQAPHWKWRSKEEEGSFSRLHESEVLHAVHVCGWLRAETSTAPPGSSHSPFQKFTLATLRKGRVRTRVCSGGGFFPLGSRSVETVKETADGRRRDGE